MIHPTPITNACKHISFFIVGRFVCRIARIDGPLSRGICPLGASKLFILTCLVLGRSRPWWEEMYYSTISCECRCKKTLHIFERKLSKLYRFKVPGLVSWKSRYCQIASSPQNLGVWRTWRKADWLTTVPQVKLGFKLLLLSPLAISFSLKWLKSLFIGRVHMRYDLRFDLQFSRDCPARVRHTPTQAPNPRS
jgi:hypothetical protein